MSITPINMTINGSLTAASTAATESQYAAPSTTTQEEPDINEQDLSALFQKLSLQKQVPGKSIYSLTMSIPDKYYLLESLHMMDTVYSEVKFYKFTPKKPTCFQQCKFDLLKSKEDLVLIDCPEFGQIETSGDVILINCPKFVSVQARFAVVQNSPSTDIFCEKLYIL